MRNFSDYVRLTEQENNQFNQPPQAQQQAQPQQPPQTPPTDQQPEQPAQPAQQLLPPTEWQKTVDNLVKSVHGTPGDVGKKIHFIQTVIQSLSKTVQDLRGPKPAPMGTATQNAS